MHIVIDGRLILPHMTGIGRYLLGLVPALAKLDESAAIELWVQRGDAIGVMRDAARREAKDKMRDARNGLRFRQVAYDHLSPAAQLRLPLNLRRARPDVFHAPHFDLPFAVPGRVVVTLHDLKYIARPDFFPAGGAARRLAIRILAGFAVRRAGRVLCDSEYTAKDAVRRLGADPRKLRVAHLGVDARFFEPLPAAQLEAVRRRYGLEAPFILFVGERRPHKNLPGLLRAFAALRRMGAGDVHLVIAGQPYRSYREPEALAEQLGLQAQVHFIAALPDADLPALYQSAAALALLSYYEGFGLPLLEAMASGTPVVAADRTSLPEVGGEAALLVDPDDAEAAAHALHTLLCDPDERERRSVLGMEHAHNFTWERCARKTMDVYREAMKD